MIKFQNVSLILTPFMYLTHCCSSRSYNSLYNVKTLVLEFGPSQVPSHNTTIFLFVCENSLVPRLNDFKKEILRNVLDFLKKSIFHLLHSALNWNWNLR